MEPTILFEIIIAMVIVIATTALIIGLYPFISNFLIKITKKSKTKLDDILVAAVRAPIAGAIFIGGISLSMKVIGPWFEHHELIQKILIIFWGLWVIWIAERVLYAFVDWYTQYRLKDIKQSTSIIIFKKIVSVAIYVIIVLLVLRSLGVDVTPIMASLGIGGLTVALALQRTLANYFSSIYLSSDKAIRIGDFIELENGVDGYVEEIGWRSVKLRTLTNNYIIVPNTSMAENMIKNFTQPEPSLSVKIPFTIAYDNNPEKVEKVAMQVAKKILKKNKELAAPNCEPLIRFKAIDHRGIEMAAFLRVMDYSHQYQVAHDFIKELIKAFKKEHIELPVTPNSKHASVVDEEEDEVFDY